MFCHTVRICYIVLLLQLPDEKRKMAEADGLEKSQSFLCEEKVPWKDEEEVIPYDIYTACSLGEHDFVREWLSKGIKSTELNNYNSGGWTALMYAAYVGHADVVNLFLPADVDVNVKARQSGSTPLMLAASCGNKSVALSLLKVISFIVEYAPKII